MQIRGPKINSTRKLPPFRGYYQHIESQMKAFKEFFLEYVEDPANASGYIELFEANASPNSFFTRKQLVHFCFLNGQCQLGRVNLKKIRPKAQGQ